MKRLPPSVFKIPTDKLRAGYYTDRYFLHTRDVLIGEKRSVRVGYQFFPREDAVICGLDEAVAILKTSSGTYRNPRRVGALYRKLREAQWQFQDASAREDRRKVVAWEKKRAQIRQSLNKLWEPGWRKLKVYALYDGDRVKENEPVLAVAGDPKLFVHLETPLLGAIARPTATATAVAKVVAAAGRKQVLFFSARFDHYWIQATDGYAALKAGAFGVSTDANADYWGVQSMGTIPHFMIGCFEGKTADAFIAFDRHVDPEINRIALVDWENDCLRTTREVLERLIEAKCPVKGPVSESLFRTQVRQVVGAGKGKLWGIRLDTSERLRDRSVRSRHSYGVCPELVRAVRRRLNEWGARALKIIVSGGFNEEKIRRFEERRVPADAYGVGSSLFRHKIDITADIVEYEGRPCAKEGRKKGDWSRLQRVK